MLRCPNCGSTAQLRLTWQDEEAPTRYIYKEYRCGCGTCFQVEYEVSQIKILNNEGSPE